jgi:ComF family protein
MASAKQLLPILRIAADAAFPPRCPSCRAHVMADGNFCAECFGTLRLIASPMCACCGVPFIVAVEGVSQCPACLDSPPDYDAARAVMAYDAVSAPLISALKFHDQWAGLERYAGMMRSCGEVLLHGADLIIPVPLHWRRLWRRRYNQSALLAFRLSEMTNIPCVPTFLQRVQPTPPQMRLDRKTRLKNVARAFRVQPMAQEALAGKVVVLVDDVMTTGATVNACARVLKQAGASAVHVLVLAHTVKE